MTLPATLLQSPGTALIAVGAVMLYVASRAAADALAGDDADRPGVRALGHCVPIAAVALMCLYPGIARPHAEGGRPQVAVGLIFATSVACLSLVLGIVTYLAPVTALPATRRAWPFVLPAALLALMAGFNGSLTWVHAGMLLVLGATVMNLWLGAGAAGEDGLDPGGAPSATAAGPPRRPWDGKRKLELALAVALALLGGWAAARGAARLETTSRLFAGALVAGTVLSPLLTLPVLGTTARLAERGQGGSAVATLVAVALFNLCLLLPLVIVANYAVTGLTQPAPSPDAAYASGAPAAGLFAALQGFGQPAPYPLVAWRIDTVVLVVLGFALIPWAIGRWTIARAESAALIFGYAVYLALVAFLSSRWR
jgi:hypothetical protein